MKSITILRHFLTLSIILYTTTLYSQERTDSHKDGFLGTVKSVKLISFEAVLDGEKVSRGASAGYQVRSYSKSGQRLQANDYTDDGAVRRSKKYTYNKKGLLTEGVDFINGELIKKEVYTYDKSGNLLEKVKYDGEGEIAEKLNYAYNKTGKQIEQDTYLSSYGELSLQEKHVSVYDDKGNNVKINYADGEGNSWGGTKMSYDETGNMVVMQNISEVGEIKVTQKYIYNDNNVLIERLTVGLEGQIERRAIVNERGQLLSLEHFDTSGELRRKSGNTYDAYGNPTAELGYEVDGTETVQVEYSYQYDKQNNWTQQMASQRGQVAYIIAREFEYFD